MTVNANGTLGGNGIIGGATIVNGVLAPGTSIGKLSFNSHLYLNAASRSQFEISKNPFTNDQATVIGNVTFGGTGRIEHQHRSLGSGRQLPTVQRSELS